MNAKSKTSWQPKISRFDRLLKGLEILNDYKPFQTSIEPVPSSFPNGAPNHSSQAYISIGIENWPVNDVDGARLEDLGWKEESGAGDFWIFS